ncbi:glycosyltransferase family 2 protein [Pelistega europaea]|uniref:Glycosyltransferase family 2 protein n=1 Tax=Pelistega europaea TaxID=106147 RepID=A0A7Y4LBD7_9BURK|nr:glycosyltransferase family 2 protein [Pelistega europaea]NOL50449.1 glycosyltransferase family 2 protein [Pelistega europaea]
MSTLPITVMTPSYNRAHTLSRVYESLLAQTFQSFEWLIVDDGSTDNTKELVDLWIAEGKLNIRYVWQTNQHKKAAFNHGVREAKGELLVALDSDDTMLPDALDDMWRRWESLENKEQYVGICGLCANPDGSIVGDKYPQDSISITTLDMYFRYKVRGEKFGCLVTDVLRKFPFPENVPGFVPESLVWRSIARAGYKTLFINHVYRTYFDSTDSLSREGVMLGDKHALGLLWLAKDMVNDCLPWFWYQPMEFIKAAIRYNRFAKVLKKQGQELPVWGQLTDWRAKLLVTIMKPVASIMYR